MKQIEQNYKNQMKNSLFNIKINIKFKKKN